MIFQPFQEWLSALNSVMKKKCKILICLDNCTAHNKIPPLQNVRDEFFAANTTAILQPMDQGTIRNFKFHYRKEVVDYILKTLDESKDLSVTLIQDLRMVSKACPCYCFPKYGLCSVDEEDGLHWFRLFLPSVRLSARKGQQLCWRENGRTYNQWSWRWWHHSRIHKIVLQRKRWWSRRRKWPTKFQKRCLECTRYDIANVWTKFFPLYLEIFEI